MEDNISHFTNHIKNWKLKKALIILFFLIFLFPLPWIIAIILFIFVSEFYWLKIIFLIIPIFSLIFSVIIGKYFFYKKYGVSSENISKLFDLNQDKFKQFIDDKNEKDFGLVEVEAKDPEEKDL